MTGDGPLIAPLRAYGCSLLALGRVRLVGLAALVVGGAVVEGLGILLLVPLAGLLFGWAAPGSVLGQIAAGLLARLGQAGGLAAVLGLFIALMALRAAVLWRRDIGMMALSAELVDSWRGRMIAALVHSEWRRLRALNRGEVEFAVTGDVARLAQGSDRLLRGAVALVQLAVLVALAVRLAPLLALAAAALLLPALPLGIWLARKAHAHGQALTGQGGKRQSAFGEFMAGMKLAKAHCAEDRYANEFLALTTDLRERGLRFSLLQLRGNALFQLLAAVLAALVLWTGAVVMRVPPAVLGAVLVLFARLPAPVLVLAQGTQALAMILPAIRNLTAMQAELAAEPAVAPHPQAEAPTPTIALAGVRLRHRAGVPLLEGVDLVLRPGELVALLGPSGAGKTSLADLLIGLTAPDAGTITIDGAPLDSPAARLGWRQRIGYVPQDPFLFDRTIAENLRWAAPQASDAELWAALEAADAAAFVRGLPAGLATRSGDRGGHFSGGERQRLCLARALLRHPALLVLDEATNALDAESEARLLGALQALRGRVTILMITHRLHPELAPDRVVRIVEGRLCG